MRHLTRRRDFLRLPNVLCFVSSIFFCATSCVREAPSEVRLEGEVQVGVQSQQVQTLVTFIIPSKGRNTLTKSLNSIVAQTVSSWEAVVLLSSNFPTQHTDHPLGSLGISRWQNDVRFRFVVDRTTTFRNCAGSLRNVALEYARTPWVAFLDDDDTVSERYVEYMLREVARQPNVNLILFRMYNAQIKSFYKTIPENHLKDAVRDHVGISFTFKRCLCRDDYFVDSITEDFLFVHTYCQAATRLCVLSPYVAYFVKGVQPLRNPTVTGGRHVIKAETSELHAAQVIESRSACYAQYEEMANPNTRLFLVRADRTESKAVKGFTQTLLEAERICWPGHFHGRKIHFNFATDKHTDAQILVLTSVNESLRVRDTYKHIWVAYPLIKSMLISRGFDARNIYNIHPLSFASSNSNTNFKTHAEESESSETVPFDVLVFTPSSELDFGNFSKLCSQLKRDYSVNCIQGTSEAVRLSDCDANIIVMYHVTSSPEWLLIDELIIAGKVVMALSAGDIDVEEFHMNFMYFYSSTADLLRGVRTALKNIIYFSRIASLSSKALLNLASKYRCEHVCRALTQLRL